MDSLIEQIQQRLRRYLSERISLQTMEDWLVANTWNVHKDNDASAEALASSVELVLAEYTSGYMNEDTVREKLWGILFSVPSHPTQASSSVTLATGVDVANRFHEDKRDTQTLSTDKISRMAVA